ALKITQEELSLQTGISRPTIRGIERGKETAQVGLVLQLCQDLGAAIELKFP
ncbi:MAG: helix-turn-helix domain-containing protein, partial [Boseongicola sp. SB0675_bin_26]|nr:helix-turn-helix domain-containing protein [Boseongicola sp. SB0675_bin_26]